ncbi:MAG: N-formylglutamate amidohydrolase [Alphaproteobacteria bacterium]|nr:N-formylglutamate amidohydrolase [Alphaproteobacteria bacterium]
MASVSNIPAFKVEKIFSPKCELLLSCPHCGTYYPPRLFELSDLTLEDFHTFEDAGLNDLISFASPMGIPYICGNYGRAWIDLNRHWLEMDEHIFAEKLPYKFINSSLVQQGYGVIPTKISATKPIYKQLLQFKEIRDRIDNIYQPYHLMLETMIQKNVIKFNRSVLLDIHSMPVLPEQYWIRGRAPDIVLGTNDGKSCSSELAKFVFDTLQNIGFNVVMNMPFTGAFTTRYYGRPNIKSHVIQIEISRNLYWDSVKYKPKDTFSDVRSQMTKFIQAVINFIKQK